MPGTDEPVIITSDRVTWNRKKNELEFEGNVVVEHPMYRINADHARARLDDKVISASGSVTVTRITEGGQKEIITSDEVEINSEQGTGWMARARLDLPFKERTFRFQGERIEKTGEHTYLIENGSFTWCNCREDEAADWSIQAKSIKVDTEGDAVVRDARIRIKDRPFARVPYFRYPVGAERRSGLLIPEIESGSLDGFQFELPYYYVINQSADATLSPRYIQGRGLDTGAELRYNFGEIAKGETRGFHIDDREEKETRGGIRIKHRTDIDDVFTAAADITFITDNEVVFDFDHRDLGDANQRALESRLVLSRHWPFMNLTTEFSAFDDLMGGDVRESPFGKDRDEQMVQRLPAISYILLTRPLAGPLMFDVSGYAANYWRQDRDLGRGQLVTILPRVALPWRFDDAVDFWVAAGYREWFLQPDPDFDRDTTYTGRAEAELYTSAQWERIFTGEKMVRRHSIRPAVIAFWADEPQKPNDDFFAMIVPDMPTELAGVHLDSRLWSRSVSDKSVPPIETARAEITQLYDFEAQKWRDLRIEGRLGAPTPWRLSLDAYHSWEEEELSRVVGGAGYVFGNRAEIHADYRYNTGKILSPYFVFESLPDESISGYASYRPIGRHQFKYHAYYSIEHDLLVNQTLEWDYLARQRCWRINVAVREKIRPDDPDGEHEVSGSVNFQIAGAPGP